MVFESIERRQTDTYFCIYRFVPPSAVTKIHFLDTMFAYERAGTSLQCMGSVEYNGWRGAPFYSEGSNIGKSSQSRWPMCPKIISSQVFCLDLGKIMPDFLVYTLAKKKKIC
jgi:hypothetical protein